MRKTQEQRFKAKFVEGQPDECWEWRASRHPRGYGHFSFDGKVINASRASWMIYKGAIPENMNVCHKCDNPPCVNPAHLFLGTQKDNIYDMHWKKRNQKLWNATHSSDESHQVSKLTNDEVRFIRSCGLTTSEIRIKLNCKIELLAIRRVLSRETYRDVK